MTTLENKRSDIITLAQGAEVDTYVLQVHVYNMIHIYIYMWWTGKQGAGCKEEWIQFRKLQKYMWKHSYEDNRAN